MPFRRRLGAVLGPLVALAVLAGAGALTWVRWSEPPARPGAARWLPIAPVSWAVTGDALTSHTLSVFDALPPGQLGDPDTWPAAAAEGGALLLVDSTATAGAGAAGASTTGYLLDDAVHLARVDVRGVGLAVDPAVTVLPALPVPGLTWQQTGRVLLYGEDHGALTLTGRVLTGPDAAGCVTAETTRRWSDGDLVLGLPATTRHDRWCPGAWSTPLQQDGREVRPVSAAAAGSLLDDAPRPTTSDERPGVGQPVGDADGWPAGGLPSAFDPLVAEDVVITAPSGQNTVLGLDEADGRVRWVQQLPGRVGLQPLVVDRTLVVADASGLVLGLDPATGVVRWSLTGPPVAGLAAGERTSAALVVGWDGTVRLVEAGSGEVRAGRGVSGPVRGATADGDGWWVVSTGGELTHLAADLTPFAVVATPATAAVGPPVVAGDLVAVADGLGAVALVPRAGGPPTTLAVADPDDPRPARVVAAGADLLAFTPDDGRAVVRRADGTTRAADVAVTAALGFADQDEFSWLVLTGTPVRTLLTGMADPAAALLTVDGHVADRQPLPGAPDPDFPLQRFTPPAVSSGATWWASSAGLLRLPR